MRRCRVGRGSGTSTPEQIYAEEEAAGDKESADDKGMMIRAVDCDDEAAGGAADAGAGEDDADANEAEEAADAEGAEEEADDAAGAVAHDEEAAEAGEEEEADAEAEAEVAGEAGEEEDEAAEEAAEEGAAEEGARALVGVLGLGLDRYPTLRTHQWHGSCHPPPPGANSRTAGWCEIFLFEFLVFFLEVIQ